MFKKLTSLNQARLYSLTNESNASIIKKFTEEGMKIFAADYGLAWGKFNNEHKYELVYKSAGAPRAPVFVKERDKNSIIIPIHYGDHVYGTIILGFKRARKITKEETALAKTIGHIAAQTITINWLIAEQTKSLELSARQKETEVLLSQEKIKTEFIANATHELRTPLAIMKGNVDLALMSKNPNAKMFKDTLHDVSVEINILAEIMKDMALLTSREENIKQTINTKTLHVVELLSQTVERLRAIGRKKNITINLKATKSADVCVLVDKKYLEKLFLNLIRNAIDYGKIGGYVNVDISREKKMVKIKIIDNGIGISKADLPNVFERFYRADKAHSSYGNHSGLGLAIAKWVTDIHKGEIHAESVHGKGSIFTVTLPIC